MGRREKPEECCQAVFHWLLQDFCAWGMPLTSLTHNVWSEAIRLRKSGDKSKEAAGGLEWVKQNISIRGKSLTASNCTVMIFWFIFQGGRIAIILYQQVQKWKEKYILIIVKESTVLHKISFGAFLYLCYTQTKIQSRLFSVAHKC